MDIWLLWCSKSWCTFLKAQKDYWTFVRHLAKLFKHSFLIRLNFAYLCTVLHNLTHVSHNWTGVVFCFNLVSHSSSLKVTKDRKAFSSTLCCKKKQHLTPHIDLLLSICNSLKGKRTDTSSMIFRYRHKIDIPNNSRYNFRLLDTHGWNFRHAHFHEEGRRTLYKVKILLWI